MLVHSAPSALPLPPRRPSLLNALHSGVTLKKVSTPNPPERKTVTSGSASELFGLDVEAEDDDGTSTKRTTVMSRIVRSMTSRRELLEDPLQDAAVNDEEWEE